MAGIKKGTLTGSGSASEYSVVYSNMKGVDLSGDGSAIDRERFAYTENMYRDYEGEGGDIIESVPGFRKIASLGAPIKKIFIYKPSDDTEYLIIYADGKLFVGSREALERGESPIARASGLTGELTAVSTGSEMLFFGSGKVFSLSADGTLKKIDEDSEQIYVPLTYVNGTENEQRNMLSRLCEESYSVGSAYKMSFGTQSLTYQVTSLENKTCRLTGISDPSEKRVYVPNRIKLGDEYYSVTEIAPYAFMYNTSIRAVQISEGVKTLGKFAFADCTALTSVILPESTEFIDNACFARCTALAYLHLGSGLLAVGSSPLSQCTALTSISYSGDASDFGKIEGVSFISGYDMVYEEKIKGGYIAIPLFGPITEVQGVTADGEALDFDVYYKGEGNAEFVRIYLDDLSYCDGKEMLIRARLSPDSSDYVGYRGFMSSKYGEGADLYSLISSSTQSARYDGRIFLSASGANPSLVFFNTRDRSGALNPLYFGEYDYFDITASMGVIKLLPCGSTLAIFSASATNDCSISYHSAKDTGIDLVPKIYPTEYVHTGLSFAYAAISFFDDSLFLCEQGLVGLDKRQVNLDRNIAIRSRKVNKALLSGDISKAKMTVWCGYLAIGIEGKIFLADSRQSYTDGASTSYEWYCLDGIGTYLNDKTLYRYSSLPDGDLSVAAGMEDTEVSKSEVIYSKQREDGSLAYYVNDGGTLLSVYPTSELYGGDFSPLCELASDGKRLYFGTECGDVCVFNNDMRGTPPAAYCLEEGFDEADYESRFGKRIDPEYYSFAGHRPKYVLKTAKDNGGIPHLTKSTVKNSMTLKFRSGSRGVISCEVKTDRGTVKEALLTPCGSLCFDSIDFSAFSFDCEDSFTRPLKEKERGWIEKQITLTSAEFASPIAIHNIAYRFRIKGKVKKS